MTDIVNDTSKCQAALTAGIGLLTMTLAFIFADSFILKNLIVPGDAAKTSNNILPSMMMFCLGLGSMAIVFIYDLRLG